MTLQQVGKQATPKKFKRMADKMIFTNVGTQSIALSRKAKKTAKRELEQLLRIKASAFDFIPHRQDQDKNPHGIFKEKEINQFPSDIFSSLSEQKNYLFGLLQSKKKIYFLVDIGELVSILNEPTIMIEERKRIVVQLKAVL